ncbi:MAG: TGS domain-containing protein [Candidatus Krumholzibacteria bacterium]|jgi:ribosome-interacting GTPase 1|nr:TGS domain-containing protein [Candidatus Krumholzibacteria bacterium]
MPTNVSPEYKRAQEQYRKAREPADRLKWLREMLSTIPKHKGTEALQADIKTKIKELTEELAGPRTGAARTGPVQVIRAEGAAQISVLGPPNAGKSSLHRALTGSRADIGAYPFTTKSPLPGMCLHQDIPLQIIDLPPISVDFMEPWFANALQPAHAALLVLDLHAPGCAEDLVAIGERLDQKRITLSDDWHGRLPSGLVPADWPPAGDKANADPSRGDGVNSGAAGSTGAVAATGGGADAAGGAAVDPSAPSAGEDDVEDPFRVTLPALLVVTKIDLGFDTAEVDVLCELTGKHYPVLAVSADQGTGLERLGALLVRGLDIVRVYTKVPGKPADYERPYTLFAGDTVADLARLIHRDLAASLQYAKVWGSAKFDGQQVGRDHPLADGDVVEIHA